MSFTNRYKISPALLNAAQRVACHEEATGWGCCLAILKSCKKSGILHEETRDYFENILRPKGSDGKFIAWGFWYETEGKILPAKKTRNARVIGLILCSILAKENFKP